MKKLLAMLLCLMLLATLAGCGGGIDIEEEDEFAGFSDRIYTIEVTSEKTALNYLTGEYNMAQDRVGYRPYCVSVNNIEASWPQYGISQADIVIEMVTEGGITRLMCLYADTREVLQIGSVRSLRDQFMEAIYPLDPIIVHIGTSIYADKAIIENNIRTLDGDQVPAILWKDQARASAGYASEHTKFTSGGLIDDQLNILGFDEKSTSTVETYFNFAEPEETVELSGGDAANVTFRFSSNIYDGDFRYDEASGTYLKFQRGKEQIDAGNNNKQLAFKNVLVLFANIKIVDQKSGLVNVDYQAGGEGYYFSNGQYEQITWAKGEYSDLFELKTADGEDLVMNAGKTSFCVVGTEYLNSLKIS